MGIHLTLQVSWLIPGQCVTQCIDLPTAWKLRHWHTVIIHLTIALTNQDAFNILVKFFHFHHTNLWEWNCAALTWTISVLLFAVSVSCFFTSITSHFQKYWHRPCPAKFFSKKCPHSFRTRRTHTQRVRQITCEVVSYICNALTEDKKYHINFYRNSHWMHI